ncbi:MAG: DISARM system phospholipase D-like protein DrmC [Myxococcales bacterium]|nr:DISARM system phospholipase D-like protein DrmC [Myxococcales bacterium]
MDGLVDAVLELVALVSPTKVGAIASSVRGTSSAAISDATKLVQTPAARAAVTRVLSMWKVSKIDGDELAGLLVGAAAARARAERELGVELVWTGPTTSFVPTRRTAQVLLELIAGAVSELFLVSFVAYDVSNLVAAMNHATNRGARLRILVEASKDRGGTLDIDLVPKLRASVPAAELYTWLDRKEPFVDGKVHAKVAVADSARAFVTSANLTGHAMERNMEAGLLLRGGLVPAALRNHLDALINTGVLGRV